MVEAWWCLSHLYVSLCNIIMKDSFFFMLYFVDHRILHSPMSFLPVLVIRGRTGFKMVSFAFNWILFTPSSMYSNLKGQYHRNINTFDKVSATIHLCLHKLLLGRLLSKILDRKEKQVAPYPPPNFFFKLMWSWNASEHCLFFKAVFFFQHHILCISFIL